MSQLSGKLAQVQGEMSKLADEIEAIGMVAKSEDRDLSKDEMSMLEESSERFDVLNAQAKTLNKLIDQSNQITSRREAPKTQMVLEQQASQQGVVPFGARRQRSKVYESDFEAYAVGQWIHGVLGKNSDAKNWLRQNAGHWRNAMDGETSTAGIETVPTPLAATIIRLVEEFGVYRRNARPAVMTSNTLDVPSRDAGLTVYYPAAQGDAITASDLTFGQVQLVAKKYAAMSVWSTELDEDSVISMTDLITTELAYAFASAEDLNSFRGDGTATYGGITGIENALLAGSKVTMGAGETALSDITLAHLHTMVGKVPQYTGVNPKFYCHSYVYHTVIVPLLVALGGTDMRQGEAGGGMSLLGYPVEFTQTLPGSGAAAGDMVVVFGDLNLGAFSGQRRQITLRMLQELFAANDQLAMTATMRADSLIHSVGTADDPGAIIGLFLAAV